MGRALSGSGERPAWAGRATFAAEAAAVAALAYLLARLAVAAFPPLVETPLGLGAAPSRSADQSWSTLDPFRRGVASTDAGAPAVAVDAPATTLNLMLVGVRAGGEGRGSAIIQTPDNQQRLYRVGDAILTDATLAAVDPGRVTIQRQDGSTESLSFDARESLIGQSGSVISTAADADVDASDSLISSSPDAGAPASVALDLAATTVNARALMTDITPFERAAGGIVVMPGADGTAFAAAGLQPFDVVLSVNGVGLDNPEAWQSAFASLGSGSTVAVDVQRAGVPVTITFVLE